MVAVIGAGAIGGYLAAMLADAGHDVTLCVRTPFHTLTIEDDGETRQVRARIVSDPQDVGPQDWVFLATKAQDTASAGPWLERLVRPGTRVVVAQNGIEHEERVRPLAAEAEIVPSVVYIAAERKGAGHILHHSSSRLIVPEGEAGHALTQMFEGSALDVSTESDFLTVAWKKLLANIVANPLTALTMRRMEVFGDPRMAELGLALVKEAIATGRAAGAALSEEDVRTTLAVYDRVKPDSGSSMLYDRLSGRSLENDHLTGALVRAADRHGVPAPLNRAIHALVAALDEGLQRGGRGSSGRG